MVEVLDNSLVQRRYDNFVDQAARKGWWVLGGFESETGQVNVDIYIGNNARQPRIGELAWRLPMPETPDEVVSVRQELQGAHPEPIISYDGFISPTFQSLIQRLLDIRQV